MKNVLVEIEQLNNTTESAREGFTKIFQEIGVDFRFRLINDITCDDLRWCDTYLSIRPNTPAAARIAKAVKQAKKNYIVFFDDDLLNRPFGLKWRVTSSKKSMNLADVLIATNPKILEDYKAYIPTNRSFLLNTPIEECEIQNISSDNNTVRIVYAAGRDHDLFFNKLLAPVIRQLLQIYGRKIQLTFIGAHPDLCNENDSEQCIYVPMMPLDQYNRYMSENEFDIGLAPLEVNSFSAGKYFNKYLEYSKHGIFGLYSKCLPYTYIVEDKINGFLVENDTVDWFDAMNLAINNTELRWKCVSTAQLQLRNQFAPDKIAKELISAIPELTAENKVEMQTVAYKYNAHEMQLFHLLDKSKRAIYQVKLRGLCGTIKYIQNR